MGDKDVIITYETVYETLRREKFRQELQELDKGFFNDVVRYINEKQSILKSQKEKNSIFAQQEIQKTEKQIENLNKILKELYERRETKIIQLALFASKTQSNLQDAGYLVKEEQELFTRLKVMLDKFRGELLGNLLRGELPKIEEERQQVILKKESNKLIHFSKAVPQFMGEDLNTYGPFEANEIANLPARAAEVLVKKNRASEL